MLALAREKCQNAMRLVAVDYPGVKMLEPAVIERELRVSLRKLQPRKVRLSVALSGAFLVSVFFLFSYKDRSFFGARLHYFLYLAGLYLAVVRPIRLTLGLFSEERRSQTLELLYLTGMNSLDLFAGKLLGGLLISSCELLALVPFLAFPFLNGGISLDLFLATAASLPTVLILVLAVSLFSSVVASTDGAEMMITWLLLSVLCLVVPIPYMLGTTLAGTTPFSPRWLILSPAFGPWLVLDGLAPGRVSEFWQATGVTWAWSAFFLCLAGTSLARHWRNDPEPRNKPAWQQVVGRFLTQNTETRRSHQLESSPYEWLVQKDYRSLLWAWSAILGLSVLWLLGWWAWPKFWPSTMNLFVTAFLLISITNWLTVYAAARRLGEDRRDGVLELMLTTPLEPAQIVEGQQAALLAQFGPVRRTVFALCVLMMLGGFLTRSWTLYAVCSYLIIWILFLVWSLSKGTASITRAMWIALNTGRPGLAVFQSSGTGRWSWVWMVFNIHNLFRTFGKVVTFPTGSGLELVVVSVAALISFMMVADRMFSTEMRDKLIREMREIAPEPLPDPKDPAFKKWNVQERFPRSE